MDLKLSLITPTFNNAATIERTLGSVFAQKHRPLEIFIYDEASRDETRALIERTIASKAPSDVEVIFSHSEQNSGPVRAWRVPLQQVTGQWCCFVWADDVLADDFSEKMMAAVERAAVAGRKMVYASGQVEINGREAEKYSEDEGVLTPQEFSLGIFLRRYSSSPINGVYEVASTRRILDRHIEIDNPMGFDFSQVPYGTDSGLMSELAAAGGGVEVLGERLVRLVLSPSSLSGNAIAKHQWQHRWQYTYSFLRVWNWWWRSGFVASEKLVDMAEARLALCEFFVQGGWKQLTLSHPARAIRAYIDFKRWDWEETHMPLEEYRRMVEQLGQK
jgi:glycosyltransferase involved in cell wall biosynthesis